MSDINKQMAEFARELWENYIKPKFIEQFTDTVTYYMATVVTNDGNNRATIKRPFDDPYQVAYLDDMAGLVAGDTVLVLRFGNGTNNANHIIFGKGNGNTNYTAAEATELANAAIKTIEYGVGTSPTDHSDITSWSSATPVWEAGKYVWQRTSTNDLTYTYTCIQGAEGERGARFLKTTTAPSSYKTPVGSFTPTYRIALATVIAQSGSSDVLVGDVIEYSYYHYPIGYVDDTYAYTTARQSIRGAGGAAGAAGDNTATVYLYQRATSTPSNPTNNLTYTFSTATLTGTIDNDWDTVIPTGTDPIYVISATAFSNTESDLITTSDWSSPVILAQDGQGGTDGINTATVYLYQRKAIAPSKPSNTLTYTFATGALSGTIDNDWLTTIPSGTDPLYITFATAASATATDTIAPTEWVTPEILAENGEDGTDGTDGVDGQMLYATCSTGASTAAKVATLSSGTLTLESGATVAVTFTNENSVADATLNISSTGAKTIRAAGANLTATSAYNWTAGATVTFVYDGTYWQMDGTAPLLKATNAAKTATDYITDVTGGVDVSGNSATAKVEITDKVRVQADSTHFSDMTATQFKIHSGNATNPSSYMGTHDAGFAGDGAGNYLVTVSTFSPDQYTTGGRLEVFNADGRGRVVIDAFGDYGTQRFFNADGNYMVDIGTATDGSYGSLSLYQTTTAIDAGYYMGAVLGKVLGSAFVNTGAPALLIYENPTPYGNGYTSDLTAAYGGGAAYIRASASFRGYVCHGKTTNHRLTYDWNTIGGYNYLQFYIDSTEVYRLQQQSYSDERVKTDIKPIKNGYKVAVLAVPIEQFRYDFGDEVRQAGNGIMFGVIAQDLIEALSDNGINYEETPLVANLDNEDESLFSVDYTQFLLARVAADEDRIKELEEKNAELEARLAAIEARLGV